MIFATVGSTHFDALVARMDVLASELTEHVLIQIGVGQYLPKNASYFRFAPSLDQFITDADLIVGHGGLGTIVETIEKGKKLVCVVNPDTCDNHQHQLLHRFEYEQYLLWCKDLQNLDEAIRQAKTKRFRQYLQEPCSIHAKILGCLGQSASRMS